jgi:hypothetical protein
LISAIPAERGVMRHRIRAALVMLAIAFLLWEAYGAFRWVVDAGGLGPAARHFWVSLRDEWMLLIVVSDHLLLAGIALVILWVDATRLALTVAHRALLAVAFIALGSPIVLGYLAWRLGKPAGLRTDAVREYHG